MPFTTWIRDALGIHKDVVDIKKAKLETEKLEAEKRERDLITPATMDDVKKYDPKYGQITRRILKPKRNCMVEPKLLILVAWAVFWLALWGAVNLVVNIFRFLF